MDNMKSEYWTAAKITFAIELTGLFILFALMAMLDSVDIFMIFFYGILIVDIIVILFCLLIHFISKHV